MKLILLLPGNRWFVEHDAAWFALEADNVIEAAGLMPLEIRDEHDIVEQARQEGGAVVTLNGPRVSAASATVTLQRPDGTSLSSHEIPIDERLLMHVEWLNAVYRDGWAPASTSLRVEGVQDLTLRVYLPQSEARGPKTLRVHELGSGARQEIRLARGEPTDVVLLEGASALPREFALSCEPELISGSSDARQLGFLLVDQLAEAA